MLHLLGTARTNPIEQDKPFLMATSFPSPSTLRKLTHELSSWDEEDSLPLAVGTGRTITIRTHEIVVAPDTPFFRFLGIFNKVALVLSTLALIATIGLCLYFSIILLDNLRVVQEMQSQIAPGLANSATR